MDPNQTNPDGNAPAATDAPQGTDAPQNPNPPTDTQGQQAAPVDTGSQPSTDGTTGGSPSQTDYSGNSGYTTTDPSQLQAISVARPSFLGIPIDGLIIGTPIFLIGVLVYAWLVSRKPHTEQLSRLDKQRKRFDAREASKPQAVDIFSKEHSDFLGRMLAEAGLEAQYDKMKSNWMLAAVGTTLVFGAFCFMQAPGLAPFSIILGPGVGSFGFFQYVKWQGNQRQRRLTAQLPQVLESMVSTLKAGSPVVECFKLISETAPDPIRGEFRRALVSLQLGKPFRDVLSEMGTRIRTQDFRLLTQAIFISQDVGANLADVVATIAEAIRERFRLRDFLAALTAQGKMTALFIGALPYFITAITYAFAPGYIMPFLNHPIARIIFIAMMIWEAVGAYILVKMTTFEV